MNNPIVNAGTKTSPLLLALVLAAFPLAPGCNQEAERSQFASPVVSPDSEAAKKAFDVSKKMLKRRQEQEAKAARRRHQSVPSEG